MKVEYIDHMGADDTVANSARVSFARSANDYTQEQNDKLIKYLAMHNHFTTFTHCFVSLAMTAPIAIKAQCDKHVVGFTSNTESRRYIKTTPTLFVPTFRHAPTGNMKQGSGAEIDTITLIDPQSVDGADGKMFTQGVLQHKYEQVAKQAICLYEKLIASGVAPEQARFVLPQGVETNWVWTGSLYAWARFYNLRTDPHAQKEIQELAKMVGDIIAPLFPVSWQALTN